VKKLLVYPGHICHHVKRELPKVTGLEVEWPGYCSTVYVRRREALRPELGALAFIAIRDSSFLLQEGGVR